MNALQEVKDGFSAIQTVDTDALMKERDELEKASKKLLACECVTGREIKKRLAEINSLLTIDESHPKLDPSFYDQTTVVDGVVLPKFSFVSINNNDTKLTFRSERRKTFGSASFGVIVRPDYDDQVPKLLEGQTEKILKQNEQYSKNKAMIGPQRVVRAWKEIIAVSLAVVAASMFTSGWILLGLTAIFAVWVACLTLAAFYFYSQSIISKITATDSIGGAIPENVRQKIFKEKENFDSMWLLREATWTIDESKEVTIKDPDPILVGVRRDHMYVIDCFDLTTSEECCH